MLFGRNAEENMRATTDRARLNAAIDAAKVSSDGTRYGPALKLAQSILGQSSLKRREAVLISDFQKAGWGGAEDARFPEGMTLTTASVASDSVQRLGAVGDVRAVGVRGTGTRGGDGRRRQQRRPARDQRAGGLVGRWP